MNCSKIEETVSGRLSENFCSYSSDEKGVISTVVRRKKITVAPIQTIHVS